MIREQLPDLPPMVIVRLRNMTAIDSTGIQALARLVDEVRASGRNLLFCGARAQPAQMMLRAECQHHVGRENICEHITEAIARAQEIFEESGCRVLAGA